MKKSYFIIIIMLISLSLLYSPQITSQSQTDRCSQYNANSCPEPECKLQNSAGKAGCSRTSSQVCVTNSGNSNNNENPNCFSNEEEGFNEENAEFYYEGVKTQGWEFDIRENSIMLFSPNIYSGDSPPNSQNLNAENLLSEGGCGYYSITYQREEQNLVYSLPTQSSTPEEVNGQLLCTYSTYPLTSGQSRISLIPGRPVQNLNQICPELQNGKPLPQTPSGPAASPPLSPPSCPSTEKCPVYIPEGPQQTFAFTVEEDSCGNKIIKPDNNGQPIEKNSIQQRADSFVKECSKKPEVLTLPPYCKNKNPEQSTFCKECLEYRNRFDFGDGSEGAMKYACSYIVNGQVKSRPDGSNCRFWLEGGRAPGNWNSEDNSAYGICKNGVCTQDTATLNSLGKSCSCNCAGRQIGWNEYCSSDGKVCAKKRGEISTLSGNICEGTSKLACKNYEGNQKDPSEAKKQCEAQGKFFYSTFSILGGTTCHCVDSCRG